jgi:hypothetical protein
MCSSQLDTSGRYFRSVNSMDIFYCHYDMCVKGDSRWKRGEVFPARSEVLKTWVNVDQ